MSRRAFRKEMRKSLVEVYVCSVVEDTLNVLGPRETTSAVLPTVFNESKALGPSLQKLVSKYEALFAPIDDVSDRERTIEHLINTGDAKPVYQNVVERKVSTCSRRVHLYFATPACPVSGE
ncbi:hypothetical protein PSTG_17007 [Puccinia striiformis f. sp. tritici PST-78]|uniref:Uncharacterized protein n=1 Tax=Puccinia striiformis f. sp. tritici PST-78 TaxID=1165861 RepID=A0A0L0URE1_9BASI|nr:hypothetical protein PSTG_17007 [Puccinia striiformis f. sp. tritici PST-78]